MVADQFSAVDDIECFKCKENVSNGDDYEAHLLVVHDIGSNIDIYMEKALEQNILDIDADKVLKSQPGTETDTEPKEDVEDVIPKIMEPDGYAISRNNKFTIALTKGLTEMVDIVEGNIEFEVDDHEIEDGQNYEDVLWEALDEIKIITNCHKLPKESQKKVLEKSIASKVTHEEDTLEQDKPPAKLNQMFKTLENPMNKKTDDHSAPPCSPAKTDKSYSSSRSIRSLYQCPKCDLQLSKVDARDGAIGTRHLIREHGLTLARVREEGEWRWRRGK